jgi:hypothetical protein
MLTNKYVRVVLITGLMLLIPLIAMLFTDEMQWSLVDFMVAAALLIGAGVTYEFVASRGSTIVHRAAVGLSVLTALLLVWVSLAVGIIGSENNPANGLYLGVLLIGLLGSFIARFRPRGMMYTLFAVAVAQAAVPFIAMSIWKPAITVELLQVLGANTVFVVLWIGSALLFRQVSASVSTT